MKRGGVANRADAVSDPALQQPIPPAASADVLLIAFPAASVLWDEKDESQSPPESVVFAIRLSVSAKTDLELRIAHVYRATVSGVPLEHSLTFRLTKKLISLRGDFAPTAS